ARIAQTVPVLPAMTVGCPPTGRTSREQAAGASVSQTTVTPCVLSSCRYGPRVNVTAPAGAAISSAAATRPRKLPRVILPSCRNVILRISFGAASAAAATATPVPPPHRRPCERFTLGHRARLGDATQQLGGFNRGGAASATGWGNA